MCMHIAYFEDAKRTYDQTWISRGPETQVPFQRLSISKEESLFFVDFQLEGSI